jgi:hypothetical protein
MRFGLHALFLAVLVGPGLCLGGCCATVISQQPAIDPVPVYLADYGIHSSLFLPTPDGRYVEYAFGDWGYAAENKCWPHDALGALLVSFQSALGRRYYDVKPGMNRPIPDRKPNKMARIECEREAVNRLLQRLDERYRAGVGKRVKNPENGIVYVKDREHYSIANNCNHLTARSLQELGCEVRGLVIGSNFTVAQARPAEKRPQRRTETVQTATELGTARIE